MRKLIAAFAIALPALSGAPAVAAPDPAEPPPPQVEVRAEQPTEAVPLGTPIQVQSVGAMDITVRASDQAMPPRMNDASVVVYDVEVEALGETAGIGPYDLNLATAGGDNLGALADIPGGLQFGLLDPGEIRRGLVAFELPHGQEPVAIVFATGNGYIQGTWAA
ncbi:hypothetical protein HGA13_05190 [Nocardia speluncae]|uniref:MPT63-like domain-containing protein n=1 Tax=Nocardia speluncae TaxID=419477 RepID=A0A846X8C2_9NOCA|nr:hypothetical protein [Nocardia speluncae]NKY32471.1 hypothetical protein [Nocardia speluncae]